MVVREGFEPSKAEPADLQSDPFGHLGTSPFYYLIVRYFWYPVGESNPCFQSENLMSLPLNERGIWCRLSESNQSPTDYKSVALQEWAKAASQVVLRPCVSFLSDMNNITIY